jgi:hypothetical protein
MTNESKSLISLLSTDLYLAVSSFPLQLDLLETVH